MSNKETCKFCKQEAELHVREVFVPHIGMVKSHEKMCEDCGQRVAKGLTVSDNKTNGDSN